MVLFFASTECFLFRCKVEMTNEIFGCNTLFKTVEYPKKSLYDCNTNYVTTIVLFFSFFGADLFFDK